MPIRRVVPNVKSDKFEESRSFYGDFLGFNVGMDLGWIITFVSPTNQTAQISILRSDQSGIHPNVSIEVADVDAVHATAVARWCKKTYRRNDEPRGGRRLFAVHPNGLALKNFKHLTAP